MRSTTSTPTMSFHLLGRQPEIKKIAWQIMDSPSVIPRNRSYRRAGPWKCPSANWHFYRLFRHSGSKWSPFCYPTELGRGTCREGTVRVLNPDQTDKTPGSKRVLLLGSNWDPRICQFEQRKCRFPALLLKLTGGMGCRPTSFYLARFPAKQRTIPYLPTVPAMCVCVQIRYAPRYGCLAEAPFRHSYFDRRS